MIDAKTFYEIAQKHIDVFARYGFKKTARNTFIKANRYEVKLHLDKYPWDPTYGKGFFIRVTDREYTVNGGFVFNNHGMVTIDSRWISEQGIVSDATRRKYNQLFPRGYDTSYGESWITAYVPKQIEIFFSEVLPAILPFIDEWTDNQSRLPVPVYRKPTQAQRKANLKFAEDFMRRWNEQQNS